MVIVPDPDYRIVGAAAYSTQEESFHAAARQQLQSLLRQPDAGGIPLST